MRRRPCVFVVFFVHFCGVGLITSCALRSYTDAALLYVLYRSLAVPEMRHAMEHIFIWVGVGFYMVSLRTVGQVVMVCFCF